MPKPELTQFTGRIPPNQVHYPEALTGRFVGPIFSKISSEVIPLGYIYNCQIWLFDISTILLNNIFDILI